MFSRFSRSDRLLSDRLSLKLPFGAGTGEIDLSSLSSSLSVEFSMKETFCGAISSAAGAGTDVCSRLGVVSADWLSTGGAPSCSRDDCLEYPCLGVEVFEAVGSTFRSGSRI